MRADQEHQRWSRIFSGSSFYYGTDPGPVARRTVRYHRPLLGQGGLAFDAGSGEGQDALFLAREGYAVHAVEWTQAGLEKTRRLVAKYGGPGPLPLHLVAADLRHWHPDQKFDLGLAVNCLQFLGADAPGCLDRLLNHIQPGGVFGFSAFAREDSTQPAVDGTIYRWTLEELLAQFAGWQPLEASRLWQWGDSGPQPFVTLIAVKD